MIIIYDVQIARIVVVCCVKLNNAWGPLKVTAQGTGYAYVQVKLSLLHFIYSKYYNKNQLRYHNIHYSGNS